MIAMAPVVNDPRSEPITIARSALSSVAENAYAACANARDAIDRAVNCYLNEHPITLQELERAAFELQELNASLRHLSFIADTAGSPA